MITLISGLSSRFEEVGVNDEVVDRLKSLWMEKFDQRKMPNLDLAEKYPIAAPTSQVDLGLLPKFKSQKKAGGPANKKVPQVDGADDTSDEDEAEVGVDDEDLEDEDDEELEEEEKTNVDENDEEDEGEPLGSEDDIEDDGILFDTENVIVCQFDKISRQRTKWKFHLRDGIMSLNGKDYVFQKALGDAEW